MDAPLARHTLLELHGCDATMLNAPADLKALLASEPEVAVAIAPIAVTASRLAQVVTDYVEARFDYRLPP